VSRDGHMRMDERGGSIGVCMSAEQEVLRTKLLHCSTNV
jgi:hypothetical protein